MSRLVEQTGTDTGMPVRIGPLAPAHRPRVQEILHATGVFRQSELDVATEVFDAALASGQRDYALVGAFDPSDHLHGYACYGATPGTEGTWDLYWFAVDPKAQRRRTGSALWQAVEREIRAHGGRRCIVETSGRADYGPARRFYERMGFTAAGRLADFYEEGDDRLTYVKRLDPQAVTPARPVAWQGQLHGSLISVEQLAERFGPERIEAAAVREAVEGFNLRITPEVLRLIRDPGDPVGRQYVPRPEENEVVDGLIDPLAEDANSPAPNITHRYPDRVLFLISPVCAAYCRFCTRRRKVGDPERIPLDQFDASFEYLRQHRDVRDVVLSGGDPLMLSDRRLEYFLSTLRAIRHIEIIRIHTRMPAHVPERITPELCEMIKRYHPVYVNVHVNHPDELTPATRRALEMLADAGCPLGSQTVLLKGVNDDPAVMKTLMQQLLTCRVRPYYLYQADVVAGTEHFRTSIETGLRIMDGLRGWTSGLAVPYFVIDVPGGGGKIPLLPNYVQAVTDDEIILRNYAGDTYRYPLPRSGVVPRAT